MKKRILSLVLILCILLALLVLPAGAAEPEIVWLTKEYDGYRPGRNGYVAMSKGGKWGLLDETGREIIPPVYDGVDPYDEMVTGLWTVNQGGKFGCADQTGKVVVPIIYDMVSYDGYCDTINFRDGLAAVGNNGLWGYVDMTGKEVVPLSYGHTEDLREGRGVVCKGKVGSGGKWGYVDATGKEVIPAIYDFANNFSEGLAAVGLNGKDGYINTAGEVVIPMEYDHVRDFSDGLATVSKDDKWGCINTAGEVVIPFTDRYDYIGSFCDGRAAVVDHDRNCGYINTAGELVIPCQRNVDGVIFFNDLNFWNGIAYTEIDGKWTYINVDGVDLTQGYDDYRSGGYSGLLSVKKNGKWGCIDATGAVVIPLEFEEEFYFSYDTAVVKKDGRTGIMRNPLTVKPKTAYATSYPITVDGEVVEFNAYALRDEKGYDTNYVKLRDLAWVLNGSQVQFGVGWDGDVTITTRTPYAPNGSEMKTPFSGDRSYQTARSKTKLNGFEVPLEAIALYDDDGGGYTYYKLRDLGKALGFNVGYRDGGIFIETDKPYTPD